MARLAVSALVRASASSPSSPPPPSPGAGATSFACLRRARRAIHHSRAAQPATMSAMSTPPATSTARMWARIQSHSSAQRERV